MKQGGCSLLFGPTKGGLPGGATTRPKGMRRHNARKVGKSGVTRNRPGLRRQHLMPGPQCDSRKDFEQILIAGVFFIGPGWAPERSHVVPPGI